jgi:hypothetical protein
MMKTNTETQVSRKDSFGQKNDKTKEKKCCIDNERELVRQQTEILFRFFNNSQHNQEEEIQNHTIKSSPKFGEEFFCHQSSANSTEKDFSLKSPLLSPPSNCSSDKLYFTNSLRELDFCISVKSNDVSREDIVKNYSIKLFY